MAEDWGSVAREIAAAIDDVGTSLDFARPVASGPAWAPVYGAPVGYTLKGVPSSAVVALAGASFGVVRSDSILVAATGETPAITDRVTVRGVTHEILEVRTTWQGGVSLLHELVLAK